MKFPFKVFIILVFIFICIFSSVTLYAGERVLLEVEDPVGDDYGPGTYKYPTNEIFQEEGLFDITSFSIIDLGEKYEFKFSFHKLTDPWKSKYGFSLPLIQIYIGNNYKNNLQNQNKDKTHAIKISSSTELFKKGANIKLSPDYPWTRMIKISGWWIRAYEVNDMDAEEKGFWNAEENPADLDADIKVKNNIISLTVDKSSTGNLENAYFYVFVGGFDPFGPDHFRAVEGEISSWSFADITNDNLDYAPRVMDVILPTGKSQINYLSYYKNDYPEIIPIQIKAEKEQNYFVFIPIILIILIIIFVVIFVSNRKSSISNTK
ncbi:MAG: glucodextranase DOMON-like domain-containing protein [Bacillota bacterium]